MDLKRISGLAIDGGGNTVKVSITVPEKDWEIIDKADMEIELRMACEAKSMRLAEVTEINYVDKVKPQ